MPIVLKSGNLNLLELSGPVRACNRIALPFFYSLHPGILSSHCIIFYTCHRAVQFTTVVSIVSMPRAGYQHYRVFVVTLNVAPTSQFCTSAMLLLTVLEN